MYSVSRNDVKKLAAQIEVLSKDLQSKLDTGNDYLTVANELVRNANTMVFALGEVYAVENSKLNSKGKLVNDSKATRVYRRDSRGRFAKNV